jgi:hypothetical protein
MNRAEVIMKLVKGAYGLAMKKERDPEVAKEWAQEAILNATIAFDRYKHLPEAELVRALGTVCRNTINGLQRKEVEKDKRQLRLIQGEIQPEVPNKICDDGHYEPYDHKMIKAFKVNPAWYPPTAWEDQLEVSLSRELLAVLLTKLDNDGQTFVLEKLAPSDATLKLMHEDGLDSPRDWHIFPDKPKAVVSRMKAKVRDWLERLGVLDIDELSSLDRQKSRSNSPA